MLAPVHPLCHHRPSFPFHWPVLFSSASSPASADSEAPQAVKSRRAVEAAAERVPARGVLAALSLRLLPPAGLRRPHLLWAQPAQEALSRGRYHSRWDCGIQANCGDLMRWPHTGLQRSSHTEEMFFFVVVVVFLMMKLSGLFFF